MDKADPVNPPPQANLPRVISLLTNLDTFIAKTGRLLLSFRDLGTANWQDTQKSYGHHQRESPHVHAYSPCVAIKERMDTP